jgi:hypothetical protein
MYKMYFDYIHPLSPSPFPFPLLLFPHTQSPPFIVMSCSPSSYHYYLYVDYACELKHVIFVFLSLLISLNMMISNSIHLPANDIISFFFMGE